MRKYKSTEDFYNFLISSYSACLQEERQLLKQEQLQEEEKFQKKINLANNLFLSFKKFWEHKKQLKKELGITSDIDFNIFSSIAEYYWYENLHSDILKNILDPTTPVIGNPNFLKCFLDLIGVDTKRFDYKNAFVERETERIDLLIYDNDSAIIIENKINYAEDQPDQLPRYYEIITDSNGRYQKEVVKIVYLTLSNQKQPSFDYSKKYRKYIPEIQKLLIHVCAVNKANNKYDASWTLSNKNSFLRDLINIAKKDKLKKKQNDDSVCIVYLQQYEQLLNSLGEDEIMSDVKEKIAKLMFETEDSSAMMKDIVNIYNDRYVYLGKVCLNELLEDKKLKLEKIQDGIIGKRISNKEYIYFAVEAINSNKEFSYGFYNKDDDWKLREQKIFENKMNTPDVVKTSQWVYKYLSYKELLEEPKLEKLTVTKMKKYILKFIEELSSKM